VTRPLRLIPAICAAVLGSAAHAGEAACWFEHGLVVVPAQVMGISGDYILDTAAPRTQLHADAAQGAGYADAELTGEVRVADLRLPRRPVQVLSLDSRAWMLPTPIAGVIGADVLRAYVVDVDFSPCRIRLSPPGRAPAFAAAIALPISWIGGRPAVRAAVADGPHAWASDFVLSTGADAPIRLSEVLAHVPHAAKPQEVYPNGVLHPRLRALSLAGRLDENLVSGLEAAEGAAGVIGAPILAHWRLRFDFPRGVLWMAPAAPEN
jgi:hypothetical protein